MSFRNFLFGTEKRSTPGPGDDFWYRPLPGYGNKFFDENSALRIAAVYACVRVLAESVASLPLPLYRRLSTGGKERETQNRLAKLIGISPNPWQTRFGFWEMMMGHVLLRGNAYSRKVRNRQGDVLMLAPLNPTRMLPEQKRSGEIVYKYRLVDGTEVHYPQSEILHLQGLSSDGIIGLSPLELLQRTMAFSSATDDYGVAFYENFAQPGLVAVHPGVLKEQARKNLKASIDEGLKGTARAFSTLVLEEGVKLEQVGAPAKDIQYIEIRQMNVTEIARVFRVPPHMIGDLSKATFSNIEQQSIDFVVNTLRPWLVRVEQTIYRDLLAEEDESLFAEFTIDGLLRGDMAARSAAYTQALTNGWLSIDEVRELENRNPLPDDLGKAHRVPLNTAPVDADPEKIDDENPKPKDPPPSERQIGEQIAKTFFTTEAARILRRWAKKDLKSDSCRAYELDFARETLRSAVSGIFTLKHGTINSDDVATGLENVAQRLLASALDTSGPDPDARAAEIFNCLYNLSPGVV